MSLALPPLTPYVPASLGPRGRSRPTGYLLVWGYVMNALAQLGMVSELPSENQTTIALVPNAEGEERKQASHVLLPSVSLDASARPGGTYIYEGDLFWP